MYFSTCIKISFLLCISIISEAQIIQSAQTEFPLGPTIDGGYTVVSIGKLGLVLYSGFQTKNDTKVEIIRLDTTLQKVWHEYAVLEEPFSLLLNASVNQTNFSFLLKGESNNFTIVNVNLESGSLTKYKADNAISITPVHYFASSNYALIGGYLKQIPIVLYFNFLQKTIKILPGLSNERGEFNQIKINTDESIDVIVRCKIQEQRKYLLVNNYDPNGDLLKSTPLIPQEKKNLVSAKSIRTKEGRQIVCGIYGYRGSSAEGLFISTIDSTTPDSIKYYNLSDFNAFFHHLSPSKKSRVLKKVENRNKKDKQNRLNYYVLINDIFPYGDQFIMINETYQKYPTQGKTGNGYEATDGGFNYGNESTHHVFGYTSATIIGFDKNGEFTWNKSLVMDNIHMNQPELIIKTLVDHERISFVYLYQNQICTTSFIGTDSVMTRNSASIVKKIESNLMASIAHWYDRFYFIYGIKFPQHLPLEPVSASLFLVRKIEIK